MGDKIELTLAKRDVFGKKVKKLRREGIVPTIVYGEGMKPLASQGVYQEIVKVVEKAGRHTPVYLNGAKKGLAIIKRVDKDPVKNTLRHVSFHAIKANEPVVTEVPIRLLNEDESEAKRAGLVLMQVLEEVEVKALPKDLPEAIEVDVLKLKEAGDKITLGDIKLPKGVELMRRDKNEEDEAEDASELESLVIVNVYEPSAVEASNNEAGGNANLEDLPESTKEETKE